MLFNSFQFIGLFLPAVVIVYWLLAGNGRTGWSILWLAIASYVFYLTGENTYPWLLAASIAINFGLGRLIASREGSARKAAMIAGVALNLACLVAFKYTNFAAAQAAAITGGAAPDFHITLPIGISFFTFTQIAFLVDVWARKAEEREIAPYGLFVAYFPHLIAGPILHHREMLRSSARPNR